MGGSLGRGGGNCVSPRLGAKAAEEAANTPQEGLASAFRSRRSIEPLPELTGRNAREELGERPTQSGGWAEPPAGRDVEEAAGLSANRMGDPIQCVEKTQEAIPEALAGAQHAAFAVDAPARAVGDGLPREAGAGARDAAIGGGEAKTMARVGRGLQGKDTAGVGAADVSLAVVAKHKHRGAKINALEVVRIDSEAVLHVFAQGDKASVADEGREGGRGEPQAEARGGRGGALRGIDALKPAIAAEVPGARVREQEAGVGASIPG